LGRLAELRERRQQAADRYGSALAGIPGLTAPSTPADRVSSWQTYAVTLKRPERRDRVAEGLRLAGIGSTIGTYALHRQPVYGPHARQCPVSGRLFDSQLALPMFPELTPAQQDRVIDVLAGLLEVPGHE
jgi:perosamine synthetase